MHRWAHCTCIAGVSAEKTVTVSGLETKPADEDEDVDSECHDQPHTSSDNDAAQLDTGRPHASPELGKSKQCIAV